MFTIATRLSAFALSLFVMIGSLIGIPTDPKGDELDLSKFELVFEDNFDGDSINSDIWRPHQNSTKDNTTNRQGGHWNESLAEVRDGNLHIYTKYLENGVNDGDPEGWYSAAFDTQGRFEQTYGYFEIRCICPQATGIWSAFWLYSDGVCNVDGSGEDGAEVDIYESAFYNKSFRQNRVSHNVHYDGYEFPTMRSCIGRQFLVTDRDPYTQYNTYGVEWNEDEYIFYINGVESYRTSLGGTAKVPEFMIISSEVGGSGGVSDKSWAGPAIDEHGKDYVADFVIDYVKVYKYK